MRNTLKNTHEAAATPAFEAARSKLSKALDAVTQAETALATARADLDTHESKMGTGAKLPKDFAHTAAELQAQITWSEKLVEKRRAEHAEAQAEYEAANKQSAYTKIEDATALIAAFSRDEFVAKYSAKLAPIAAEAWSELHSLTDLESEIAAIAREAGITNSDPRYSVPNAGSGAHAFDGVNLAPAGLSSSTVTEALTVPEDPRLTAYKAELAAEAAEKRAAQKELEAAEKEWIAGAPMREARARFDQAHANWTAERDRRVSSHTTTVGIPREPIFADRSTW